MTDSVCGRWWAGLSNGRMVWLLPLTPRVDSEEEPGRSALIGPARSCQKTRGRSNSGRHRRERRERVETVLVGWKARTGRKPVRRGRSRCVQNGEETVAADAPIG